MACPIQRHKKRGELLTCTVWWSSGSPQGFAHSTIYYYRLYGSLYKAMNVCIVLASCVMSADYISMWKYIEHTKP